MSNQIISADRFESSPTEPVSLTEAKAHLILASTFTADDTLLAALITACRQAIETFCHISIARQQITTIMWWDEEQELPYGPVTDLLSVETSVPNPGSGPIGYETATSGWQTDGGQFKTFAGGCGLRYRLVYMAEYSPCPEGLKKAILNELAYRYEARGEATEFRIGVSVGICDAARILALPYKRMLWQ